MELSVTLADDRVFDGETSFQVDAVSEGERSRAFASFRRPPYVVEGLVPATYRLTIYKPFHSKAPIQLDMGAASERAAAEFREP